MDIPFSLNFREATVKDLAYNTTISDYIDCINVVSKSPKVLDVKTKIYEFPINNHFTLITLEIKRCCAVSVVHLFDKEIYVVEADRTIWGSKEKWNVATLLLSINGQNWFNSIHEIVIGLAKSGHWDQAWLSSISFITYQRLKHTSKTGWINRFLNVINFI